MNIPPRAIITLHEEVLGLFAAFNGSVQNPPRSWFCTISPDCWM